MDINRNQYFLGGLVLFLLGIQFHMVDTIVFTPECTRLLGEGNNHPAVAVSNALGSLVGAENQVAPKTVRLPESLSWGLLSAGAVLGLHSLAMKKPGA
jgi:hypothetical protein